MDRCSKFKVFNFLLVFCVANFLLYRYFTQDGASLLAGLHSSKDKMVSIIASSAAGNNSGITLRPNSAESVSTNTTLLLHQLNTHKENFTSGNSPHKLNSTGDVVQRTDLPLCPLVPPRLNGPLSTYTKESTWEETATENPGLKLGGHYKPPDCRARHRVAIIIPYRNREKHLKILLKNLHPMLARQQLDYGIIVVEQALPGKFNRAMLMNIGYVEALKRYNYQCAVFHDVDLIPENDRNIYSCPEMPRHLSVAIDKFHYKLPYAGIYGGVSAILNEHFEKMNGFSNMFFGWGGEDDDMSTRLTHSGFKITRYPLEIARYKMIKHNTDSGNELNPQRFELLKTTTQRMPTDGLNSLVYKVQQVEELPTHLRIQVLINESDILKGKL